MTRPETALVDVRLEYVDETTIGETPSNPSWNRFSDYVASAPGWDPTVNQSENNVSGSGDTVAITRGNEEHSLTVEYWLQEFLVDGSGNVQNPVGEPFDHDYDAEYPSQSVVYRRKVQTSGGNIGGGYRHYIVARGGRPVSATIPGDASEDSPQTVEVGYDCEFVRAYYVHQPDSGTTLDLVSTDSADTGDVIIESDDANTSETISLNGTTTVTTSSSFSTIDAIDPQFDLVGDLSITDGGGNDVLETPIRGTNTNGLTADQGIPALGTGSHSSAIGTAVETYQGLKTVAEFGGSSLADRVYQFDLSAEVETDVKAQDGTRRPFIAISNRTVESQANVAGPFQTAVEVDRYLQGTSGDFDIELGGTTVGSGEGTITLTAAEVVDVDEQSWGAGDGDFEYGVTFQAVDDDSDGAVVTLTNN